MPRMTKSDSGGIINFKKIKRLHLFGGEREGKRNGLARRFIDLVLERFVRNLDKICKIVQR
jgi:hypothetical protein